MLYLIESIEDRNVLVDSVTLEMKGVTRKQLLDMVREGTNIGNIDGKLLLDNPECKFLISAYKPATSMCLERLPEKLLYTFLPRLYEEKDLFTSIKYNYILSLDKKTHDDGVVFDFYLSGISYHFDVDFSNTSMTDLLPVYVNGIKLDMFADPEYWKGKYNHYYFDTDKLCLVAKLPYFTFEVYRDKVIAVYSYEDNGIDVYEALGKEVSLSVFKRNILLQ